MKLVSKIIASLLALLQFLAFAPNTFASGGAAGQKRMVMVSAYYSPLPGQRFYMRGSYEADIRLNGRGTNGADGTEVYVGMLAAPKSYPFGTQVRIPGLGVGVVHDRGGAIYAAKNYDRIDVWMGEGEDGLSRALNWGMRLVEGEVSFTKNRWEPEFKFSHISSTLPENTLNRLMARTLLNPQTFTKPISKSSPKADIADLQEALRMFGYYHGEVSGEFNAETREALKVFQISEGIVANVEAPGSGNFGPRTQTALKSKIENFNSTITKERGRLNENLEGMVSGLGKKSSGQPVYKVQQMLWELGYYQGSLTGVYDRDTMDAVFRFQKDQGIVQSGAQTGAGYFGEKTFSALTAAMNRRIEKISHYPGEMQVYVPAKVELPRLADLKAPAAQTGISLSFKAGDFGSMPAAEMVFSSSPKALFVRDLSLNDRGEDVTALQEILIETGLLAKGLKTGVFGEKTEKALIRYQIENKIVASEKSVGAGVVGPKTRSVLNAL